MGTNLAKFLNYKLLKKKVDIPTEKCELTWVDSFTEFENVLQGQHRTAWKQTLNEHFPEPVDTTRPNSKRSGS